jgi:hypothetical protein
MTEAEWLACDDPTPLLEFARGTSSNRKIRLFAVGCCRAVWDSIPDGQLRDVIRVVERHLDGTATDDELDASVRAAHRTRRKPTDVERVVFATARCGSGVDDADGAGIVAEKAGRIAASSAARGENGLTPADWRTTYSTAQRQFAVLLRDIFGNPFCPVTFSPSWRTDTAVSLARQMYDSRDFSAMPILADALQDAGCDSDDVLNHCRGPGPHVRGCWVCDLVLGKE